MSASSQPPPAAQAHQPPAGASRPAPLEGDSDYLLQAFEGCQDFVFAKDLQGHYRFCNHAFSRFVKRRPEAIQGLCDADLFPGPIAAACRAGELLSIQTGEAHRSKEWLSSPDGEQVLVDVWRGPSTAPDGSIDGLVCVCRDITRLHQAQTDLQTCEANFEACFNASSNFKFILSMDGHIHKANHALHARLGYAPRELNGEPVSTLLTFQAQQLLTSALTRAAAGFPVCRILTFRTRDAKELPVETEITVGLWSGARALFCSGRDVSDQLHRKELLHQLTKIQEQLLLFATELVNLPLEHIEKAVQNALANVGRLVCADRAYLFVYDRDALVLRKTHEWNADGISSERRPPYQAFPPQDTTRILGHLRDGVVHIPQTAELDQDDNLVELMVHRGIQSLIALPLLVPSGCLGFLGFDTVVAERQWTPSEIDLLRGFAEILASVHLRVTTEKTLLKRNEDMEMLLDTMDAHVWYLDNAETYGLVNRAHADFLGFPREDIQRKPFRSFHPPEIAEACLQINRKVFASGNSIRRQEWLVSKTGESRLFEIVKTPSVTLKGNVAYVVCVANDITDKALLQQELIRSRDEAENTAKLKARLLADMSHEIRTPLNVILGYLQIMDRECIDCPQKQSLKAMTKSGEHLLDLINDILSVIRHDSCQVLLNESAFNLPKMIEDIKILFDKNPDAMDLTFETSIDDDVPDYVVSDKSRVRQILMNLVANAVKFTEKGFVRIHVFLGSPTASQQTSPDSPGLLPVTIEVQDSGCGIPANQQDAIFEPYVRLKQTLTGQEGTGLGLALCRRYARAMDGDISVTSEVGRGSIFRYVFHARAVDANHLSALASKPIRVMTRDGHHPRILVVDDDPAGRDMQIAMLQLAGFEAVAAESGYAALERIRHNETYSVILLDQRMPGMDGIETLKRIRALANTGTVKVLLMSASGFKEDSDAIRSLGGAGVIPKPIRMDLLLEEIGRVTGLTYHVASQKDTPLNLVHGTALEHPLPAKSSIPSALHTRISRAIHSGDIQAVRKAISELQATQPEFARILDQLAEAFDYDGLTKVLKEVDSAPQA